MAVARHDTGVRATLTAFASQIHPVFMLPPVAASLFGAFLAPSVDPVTAGVHATAISSAVYTAHVKDGYVDFYVRGEDDDHPLTAAGCRIALAAATTVFAACTLALLALAGPISALLTLPTWFLGYLHAPQLDTHPVTTTTGYPAGIALALAGANYTQTGAFATLPLLLAAVFFVALAGVKTIDDTQDYAYDRSIDKRTVAVALGLTRARTLGFTLLAAALLATAAAAALGVLPTSAILAVFAYAAIAAIAHRADSETAPRPSGDPGENATLPSGDPVEQSPRPSSEPGEIATALLVRGAYVFFALLLVAVWFRPMTRPLPDITVLGPYTYLATELAFGTVALALLYRARAIRTAARTIVVLYPLAYLWDWYTLGVGVFSINARTGIDLLNIPIEEHLFILVVTALIVGVHEHVRESRKERTERDA